MNETIGFTGNEGQYRERLKDFLRSRLRIVEPNDLDKKTDDELRAMLPDLHSVVSASERFKVFDLQNSREGQERYTAGGYYHYPTGAACDIPVHEMFLMHFPPTDDFKRAKNILRYWELRLSPVATDFDNLRLAMLNDKVGHINTSTNLEKLKKLQQQVRELKAIVDDARDAAEKADPNYRTPEQKEADAKAAMAESARKQQIIDQVKALEV